MAKLPCVTGTDSSVHIMEEVSNVEKVGII